MRFIISFFSVLASYKQKWINNQFFICHEETTQPMECNLWKVDLDIRFHDRKPAVSTVDILKCLTNVLIAFACVQSMKKKQRRTHKKANVLWSIQSTCRHYFHTDIMYSWCILGSDLKYLVFNHRNLHEHSWCYGASYL